MLIASHKVPIKCCVVKLVWCLSFKMLNDLFYEIYIFKNNDWNGYLGLE